MKTTIVIYGSSTGTCESVAQSIAAKLGVQAMNVQDMTADTVNNHDNLILGTSTWGAGEMHDDWYDGVKTMQSCNLAGKCIALFGTGDAESYGDTFVGGMGELYNALKDSGAHFVGSVDTADYTFTDSDAVICGMFVGLPIDEINEEEKTEQRINEWVARISPNL